MFFKKCPIVSSNKQCKILIKMAEISQKVKTYLIEYICDHCEKQKVEFNGVEGFTGGKYVYDHFCSNCKIDISLENKYPLIKYLPLEEYGNSSD